ncbi:MAG TPA: FKBP-type peptidyl-prolyl cis-trans isomerase [Denitromonas sp.]|uniref:FKBP-type peptidyl-prolyl cis-trans isomerase n=1 Tax=Denitromonas sp. TaxID=2734609 RepID=UPI001D77309B|nr:FKBP-type peptidyl-prolyl cis-trans isomerase [Rhodocyclaceae bacterium]HPR06215.1 FKBP-type peptidyl-prolyl cis-trans isomerase [Denitromonas sp.]HQU88471.1 FKBP-type peptidyl-prolyl cis-trans isomerase [Denitromonas sp.]HQV14693.1 FKBP-type peptidyl-prolyl cis-trans isomerase [Denitromonas sp.]
MKRTLLCSALMTLTLAAHAGEAVELKTLEQKIGYGAGMQMGQTLVQSGMDMDEAAVIQGLKDALAGRDPRLSGRDMREAFVIGQEKADQKKIMRGQANLDEGLAYLAKNGKEKGVVTTASGLQYKVLKAGTGKTPGKTDTVVTHYTGKLLDGTVFDSSRERGEPASFQVSQVITGWTEVLQLMKEGARYEVVIPSELAYGTAGAGGKIGPNAALIFDVELISVK